MVTLYMLLEELLLKGRRIIVVHLQVVTYQEREIAITRNTAFPDGAVLDFRCNNSGPVQYAQVSLLQLLFLD